MHKIFFKLFSSITIISTTQSKESDLKQFIQQKQKRQRWSANCMLLLIIIIKMQFCRVFTEEFIRKHHEYNKRMRVWNITSYCKLFISAKYCINCVNCKKTPKENTGKCEYANSWKFSGNSLNSWWKISVFFKIEAYLFKVFVPCNCSRF